MIDQDDIPNKMFCGWCGREVHHPFYATFIYRVVVCSEECKTCLEEKWEREKQNYKPE